MLFAAGDELGREELAQQIDRYGVVDHQEQLLIHEDELFDWRKRRVHGLRQLVVFFVKEVGQGTEQRVLTVKIVIERATRGAGGLDDLLDGGVVVALLVK